MGFEKTVQFKDRTIKVKTINAWQQILMSTKGLSVEDIIEYCISVDDKKYIESLDFDTSQAQAIQELLGVVIEVNPSLFPKKVEGADSFLSQKRPDELG